MTELLFLVAGVIAGFVACREWIKRSPETLEAFTKRLAELDDKRRE